MHRDDINKLTSQSFEYDPTPNRKKHRWKKNVAGFANFFGQMTGRCPNDIRLSEAQVLLNDAVPDPPSPFDDDPYPKRLYNVFRGVVYVAISSNFQMKYHAYPHRGVKKLAPATLRILEARAVSSGYHKVFLKWSDEYA